MKLSVVATDDTLTRIRCEGQIILNEVYGGGQLLEPLLGPAGYAGRVLFDLETTTYIDSSGVSWMLICHKHFVQRGGRIVFHSIPPLVKQVLDLLRLNLVLHLAEDEGAAAALALEGKQ